MPRYSAEELKALKSKTDKERLDAVRDAELTEAARSDPDNPPLDDTFFAAARKMRLEDLVRPPKKQITIRLDADVLEWFRSSGKGYQSRINAVLRAYKDAAG